MASALTRCSAELKRRRINFAAGEDGVNGAVDVAGIMGRRSPQFTLVSGVFRPRRDVVRKCGATCQAGQATADLSGPPRNSAPERRIHSALPISCRLPPSLEICSTAMETLVFQNSVFQLIPRGVAYSTHFRSSYCILPPDNAHRPHRALKLDSSSERALVSLLV
jgi:hypothetical protein